MTSEDLDFSKICRVCCATDSTTMTLFKVHISKKLMNCASVQVWPNDGLPGQICKKCVGSLHNAFQFKKLCEKSDARLRHYLQNLEIIQENQLKLQQQMVTEQQQHQQQQQQQDFVYVECTPTTSVELPTEVRHYETMQTATSQQLHHLTYGNSINGIQGTYPIHGIQFQTYNVPVSVNPQNSNQILALGQINPPLQPIITNQNQLVQSDTKVLMKLESKKQPPPPPPVIASGKLKSTTDSSRTCQICGKEFASSTKLSRHMKTHSGEMAYRCNFCHKGFSHSGNFKVHMRMHTDERPYRCGICEKACRQQQDLEKHMRTHTGEKPHICKECLKAFSTSSNLIAHSRIHSGEKPYVCTVCQKSFCQSNELTKHARTHTGEKSHICEVCHKGFNGSSTLVVHMRSHTGERPYICSICNKGIKCLFVVTVTHLIKFFFCRFYTIQLPSSSSEKTQW